MLKKMARLLLQICFLKLNNYFMVKKIWIMMISCALVLSACSSVKNDGGGNGNGSLITGVEWKLVSVKSAESDELLTPNADKKPTLLFDAAKSTFSGSGGCNRLMGPYELKGSSIKFGNTASSMMMCMDYMHIESAVIKALQMVDNYRISNNQLILKKGSTVLATYSK